MKTTFFLIKLPFHLIMMSILYTIVSITWINKFDGQLPSEFTFTFPRGK